MLGVSIKSDRTIFPFIFMPTFPWTSLESSFKPQVAHQFGVKMASQKGTTQWDKVVCIFLYTKGDRYAQKRLSIHYCNEITIHKDGMWGSCKTRWLIFFIIFDFLHIIFYSNIINIWWNHYNCNNSFWLKWIDYNWIILITISTLKFHIIIKSR